MARPSTPDSSMPFDIEPEAQRRNDVRLQSAEAPVREDAPTIAPARDNAIVPSDDPVDQILASVDRITTQAHQVALYMVDGDSNGRGQTVQVTDATTGVVLDNRAVSNFYAGQWLVWNVKGHVKITLTHTAGANAVASGIMFGPAV